MSKIKKILTLDQLVQFCDQNKMYTFDSKDTGYTLSVRVPAVFSGEVESDKGILFCPIKVCHIDKNRNGSFISKENMEKAMPSLKYRPFLGNIHQLDNGEWDFHSHDMEIIENEDGEQEINYIEKQIGCFTADDPYLEYDEEMDKTYVIAKVAIPEEYTKAADIIRAKNGTKVSCELNIESMSYNNTEKALSLDDFYFSGCTGLGREKDGTEIGEGMLGSRLDLEDFSTKNNSMFSQNEETNNKLIEVLEKLENKIDNLSNFNINKNNQVENTEEETQRKEDVQVENEEIKVEEEVTETEKVEVTASEESTEEVTETTTENESEETVEETPEVVENMEETASDEVTDEVTDEEEIESKKEEVAEETETETNEETEVTETEACGGSGSGSKKKKKKNSLDNGNMELSFEISHDEIRYALYNLIEQYDELDNDWYYISAVYDDKFIMEGWNGDIYGQKYSKDGDNIALDGERYKLYAEYVTESEKAELESMRSNYAELAQFKLDTENAQLHSQKEAILADERFAVIAEKVTDEEGNETYKNEAYAKLVSEMDNYSLTDLEKEVKSVFADYITTGGQFALHEEEIVKPTVTKKTIRSSEKKMPSRYGNLFSK